MGYEGMNIVLTKLQGGEVKEFVGTRHETADEGQRRRVRERSAGHGQVTAVSGV